MVPPPPTPGRAVPRAAVVLGAIAVAAGLAATAPAPADARVELGVYQDAPLTGVPALARRAGGHGTKVMSVYVTAGRPLDARIVKLARARGARLMVSWMPDAGRDGSKGKRYRVRTVASGRHDASLRALARQMAGLRPAPILRPMPEPNTDWYAWSGTAKGNSAAGYVAAWKHVRRVTRKAAPRVQLLWAPYVRSIPEQPGNEISAYFPGADQVDLVGASGYNFGAVGGLAWADPEPLFADAYREITALAPKPFWIAETASTGKGGDKAAWIQGLGRLDDAMPLLAGMVWYDVREPAGDFRIASSGASMRAFRSLARGAK